MVFCRDPMEVPHIRAYRQNFILKYHKDEGAKSHQHEFFFDLTQRCPKALLIVVFKAVVKFVENYFDELRHDKEENEHREHRYCRCMFEVFPRAGGREWQVASHAHGERENATPEHSWRCSKACHLAHEY